MQARTEWLNSQLAQEIDEPYQVNDVFAGTRSYGNGRLVGTVRGEILPSNAVGRWILKFRGTSTARTSGSQDGVRVVSRATTQVAGTKPFELDTVGLSAKCAKAGATTSVVYESIDAPGLPRRRERAISETYARRPRAEAEGADYARRSLLEQMNEQAAEMTDQFNRSYHSQFRDPRLNALRPAPAVRVRAADGLLRWECRLESPSGFAAPVPPPQYEPGTDVVMSMASSALEEQAAVTLGGRQLTGAELLEALGRPAGEAGDQGGDDFSVSFDADPCDVRFVDGVVQARLFITNFDSADVKYPAMTVDAAYAPQERDGQVVFVRQGRLRVAPLASRDGSAPKISGRQQTLRLAVQRKLEKVLTEELSLGDVELPVADQTPLRAERVQLSGPWLQIGLSLSEADPPAAPPRS